MRLVYQSSAKKGREMLRIDKKLSPVFDRCRLSKQLSERLVAYLYGIPEQKQADMFGVSVSAIKRSRQKLREKLEVQSPYPNLAFAALHHGLKIDVSEEGLQKFRRLSDHEDRVMDQLVKSVTLGDAARQLGIADMTVAYHLRGARKKLGLEKSWSAVFSYAALGLGAQLKDSDMDFSFMRSVVEVVDNPSL